MSNYASARPDLVVATMTSLTIHEADHTATDDFHATTPTSTDPQPYVQGKNHMVTGTEAVDTQPKDATDAASSSTETALSTSSTNLSRKISPDTPEDPNAEAACTAIQSTSPVPTIYPPRRPNIFRTRQKHLCFPTSVYGRGQVGPDAVNTTQKLEAADGFSVADIEEFQAEIKERMMKTSEKFMNMVRQSAWQQRRVEDLGEVFEIEN
ncbi:hypothetical protein B0H65DRAFT_439251 [Neurospora tetraspora]|uniref:Uncharacterized protein n=1 Tax=Neurospora tetraspora TaxID=94610 RepID=A0AAE0JRD4_9PEZI|nr:hypothetical protein B0H65DRAFT_439251 [Neurospora tetraspora]